MICGSYHLGCSGSPVGWSRAASARAMASLSVRGGLAPLHSVNARRPAEPPTFSAKPSGAQLASPDRDPLARRRLGDGDMVGGRSMIKSGQCLMVCPLQYSSEKSPDRSSRSRKRAALIGVSPLGWPLGRPHRPRVASEPRVSLAAFFARRRMSFVTGTALPSALAISPRRQPSACRLRAAR